MTNREIPCPMFLGCGLVAPWLLYCNVLLHALPQNYTDSNIPHSIASIERKLKFEPFQVKEIARFEHLQLQANLAHVMLPKRVTLQFADGAEMKVKWKTAVKGGAAFNNQPRYEIAAYQFQRLFLEPAEYIVPPTFARSLPVQQYRALERDPKPTFEDCDDVLFVLQYWLSNVTYENVFDEVRFDTSAAYARHFANLNLFCHLIRHSDANPGNILVSTDPDNPRVFAVDNGIAFGGGESVRGTEWRYLKVERFPVSTVNRLRLLSRPEIEAALGVVAQFKIDNRRLIPVTATENLQPEKGVRRQGHVVQFGLTRDEIAGVASRIESFLKRVDNNEIQTF